MAQGEAVLPQHSCQLQPADDAHCAVKAAAVPNGVQMRAHGDGGQRAVRPLPAADQVSYWVDPDGQPRGLHLPPQVVLRRPVLLRVGQPRNAPTSCGAVLRQRLQRPGYTLLICKSHICHSFPVLRCRAGSICFGVSVIVYAPANVNTGGRARRFCTIWAAGVVSFPPPIRAPIMRPRCCIKRPHRFVQTAEKSALPSQHIVSLMTR